jgi:hypothetical protein
MLLHKCTSYSVNVYKSRLLMMKPKDPIYGKYYVVIHTFGYVRINLPNEMDFVVIIRDFECNSTIY